MIMDENVKSVNLEGIFYDENGDLTPLTGSYGNINGNLSSLRDTYMKAERDYFEALLIDEKIREYFYSKLDSEPEELFNQAMKIQELLEYGDLESAEEKKMMEKMTPEDRDAYHMRSLERAEGIMCLLYAAAKDKVKVLELVNTHSRTR